MAKSAEHIPAEVRDLLAESRFGITFPCPTGCQMRFIQEGKDLGQFYAYSHWGGMRGAVEAAISRNQQLRALYKRNKSGRPRSRERSPSRSNTGVLGVSKNTYFDKRRNRYYARYMASWRKNSENRSKGFHLAAEATPGQHLHAFRSAMAFRHDWEEHGDTFDPARFKPWKQKRLYEPGSPDLPSGFWE
ncbi:hypothetical protein [Marinobacter salicampi]|uniref:hypothetical protein n=1 Tax=Marinobacter salicampi TaxID=435907 RepID=UPI001408F627|nr:hypothetical protein [Marinobacter salicampi]